MRLAVVLSCVILSMSCADDKKSGPPTLPESKKARQIPVNGAVSTQTIENKASVN